MDRQSTGVAWAGMEDWVRDADPFDRTCPSRALLASLGDKWSILIILSLDGEQLRYGELEQAVDGISPKMLTQRLRRLVDDGILVRWEFDEVPPHVAYELTDLGRSLLPVFYPFIGWLIDHTRDVEEHHGSGG